MASLGSDAPSGGSSCAYQGEDKRAREGDIFLNALDVDH